MTKKEILDYFSDINEAYNNAMSHDNLSSMLDELIGEDRQEIVWCKDCKYWKNKYREYDVHPWLPCMEIHTSGNWFCGYGERRETDD